MSVSPHRYSRVWIAVMVLLQLAARGQSDNLQLQQLDKPVRIQVDQWGVPHIYAETEHDLFFAQGYQAASDRLFQFEIFRRRATGTMAEAFGPSELKRDIGSRLFRYRGAIDEELAHYHPRGRQIIQAFVDGINAYVGLVRTGKLPMPIEFELLHIQPGFWTPEVVISRHNGLLMNVERELAMARDLIQFGEQRIRDLYAFSPRQPLLQIDSTIPREALLDKRILQLYTAFRAPVSFSTTTPPTAASTAFHRPDADGSNNWVISGARSASGFPLLGNDPHRVVAMPSLRYMIHLQGAGWNIAGGGEPTLPGVSIGHNEYGAWGLTIFETDAEDLYVYKLKPGDPSRYWHQGSWRAFEVERTIIPVRNSAAETVSLLYSVHGPVSFVDTARGVAYAVRCGWLEKGAAPYLASLRMGEARDWNAFREACTYSYLPAENMVWADRSGHIGWQAAGIAPIRKTHSGLVPVPGDGRFEWAGYLPVRQLPSAHDPAAGFISTANEENVPEGYAFPDAVGYTWAESYRQQRIQQVLQANPRVFMTDMERLQTDWFSLPAAELVPLLQQLDITHPLAKLGKDMLMRWDYRLDPEASSASVYIRWEHYLERQMLQGMGIAPDSSRLSLNMHRMVEYLGDPGHAYWRRYGMVRDSILLRGLFMSVADLAGRLGPDTTQWRFGQSRLKHVQLAHPLAKIAPTGMRFETPSLPRGGNGNTVASTGDKMNQDFGASFRILVDCSNWDSTRAINTPGQGGDPTSPHFMDLFERWAKNQYFPLYYSKEKVDAVTEKRIMLMPEKAAR